MPASPEDWRCRTRSTLGSPRPRCSPRVSSAEHFPRPALPEPGLGQKARRNPGELVTPRSPRGRARAPRDSPCDAKPRRGGRDSAQLPRRPWGASLRPGDPAAPFPLADTAGAARFPAAHAGVWPGRAFSSLLLPQQGCSLMCPVGIFFIISPLDLINPHSVMNLEISIKHTVANQHGTGGVGGFLPPSGEPAVASGSGPGRQLLTHGLSRLSAALARQLSSARQAWPAWGSLGDTLGTTFSCPSCRAGRSALWPGGSRAVRPDPRILFVTQGKRCLLPGGWT